MSEENESVNKWLQLCNYNCNNLADILMSEEEFPYETNLYINAEELTLVFYVHKAPKLSTLPLAIPKQVHLHYLLICLPPYLSIYLHICLSISLSLCLSACVSI